MSTSRPTGRGARLALAVAIAAAVLAACHPKYETIIPETTKVAAEATRDALESYDPATGELRFAADTPTLQDLEPGDVLVSEPAAAAPGGLLRKVESVRREGGEVVVETTQANLTDAITQGKLTAQGDLKAEQVVSALGNLPGVTASFRGDTAGMPHVGTGDGYEFHVGFDEVALDIGADDVNVAVVLNGELYFNAGWMIDLGIEPCLEVPPVCVDRFEAYVGVTERLKVSFSGEANAKLTKEVSVATYYFKPLVFFIGPVPVVVVPSIEVFVGAEGSVSLRFAYGLTEEANAVVGAKWTDDGGWQDITGFGVSLAQQDSFQVDATMGAHAYARAVASLKFYDVAGPALGLRLGVEFDAEVPRDPILLVRGSIQGYVAFLVDLPVLGTLSEHKKVVFDEAFDLARSPNQPPRFSGVASGDVSVEVGRPVVLGPRSGSLQGYFDVSDPEGGDLKIVAVSDKDGTIPLTYTYRPPRRRGHGHRPPWGDRQHLPGPGGGELTAYRQRQPQRRRRGERAVHHHRRRLRPGGRHTALLGHHLERRGARRPLRWRLRGHGDVQVPGPAAGGRHGDEHLRDQHHRGHHPHGGPGARGQAAGDHLVPHPRGRGAAAPGRGSRRHLRLPHRLLLRGATGRRAVERPSPLPGGLRGAPLPGGGGHR